MKTPFRKTHRDFSEEIFKNAKQQNAHGVLGNELNRDFLIDDSGNQYTTKYEFTGLRIGNDGIPQTYTVRVGIILDCGHKISCLDEVLGRCKYGHTICKKDELFTCSRCGAKICLLDRIELDDGTNICQDHGREVMVESVGCGVMNVFTNTLKGLIGVDGNE